MERERFPRRESVHGFLFRHLALVLLFVVGPYRPAGAQEASQPAGPARSVWEGVYTPTQARRGRRLYRELCASCHGSNARGGDVAPGLVGLSFDFRWSDSTVGAFFEVTRTTMPQARPGDLADRTYADIVTFLLQANDYPPGDHELPADVDELRRIVIDERPEEREHDAFPE